MAKQSSIIKIEGTIDDLTFYKSKNGYRVRKKGGISADRIQNDPAFQRTRENGQEFAIVARSGKVFRRALIDLLAEVRDETLVPRMVRRFSQIRNLDTNSPRGERSVQEGLKTEEGKTLLRGFNFNKEASLQQVLRKDIDLDTATGNITLDGIVPSKHLSYPEGATHAAFRAGFLRADLDAEITELQLSDAVEVVIDNNTNGVDLSIPEVPSIEGTQVHLLLVEFYQELNGTLYPLHSGAHNALSVVEVA